MVRNLPEYNIEFISSEKATKFFEISTLLLTGTTWDKSKVEILQNFVAFSEYVNFNNVFVMIDIWNVTTEDPSEKLA